MALTFISHIVFCVNQSRGLSSDSDASSLTIKSKIAVEPYEIADLSRRSSSNRHEFIAPTVHLTLGSAFFGQSVRGSLNTFAATCVTRRRHHSHESNSFESTVAPPRMVMKESTMLPLQTKVIPFTLIDTATEAPVSVSAEGVAEGRVAGQDAKALLVMFICNHCPFVVHIRDKLVGICAEYQRKGVAVVAVSSNDLSTHPQDGPELMAKEARERGFTFPYCFDATQEVAKQYRAACTPDFYLFDSAGSLAYRGQFDSSRPSRKDIEVTGEALIKAMEAVLAGTHIAEDKQTPSIGCNIKWTPGREPDYF